MTVNHGIDRVQVTFDDESLVADAGLLLVATVAARLGLEAPVLPVVPELNRMNAGFNAAKASSGKDGATGSRSLH